MRTFENIRDGKRIHHHVEHFGHVDIDAYFSTHNGVERCFIKPGYAWSYAYTGNPKGDYPKARAGDVKTIWSN